MSDKLSRNDAFAIIADLDRQIDAICNAMYYARQFGNNVDLDILHVDYSRLMDRIASIRAEIYSDDSDDAEAVNLDTPDMVQKRMDRLEELGRLNRWIEVRQSNLRTIYSDAPDRNRMLLELSEQALRRIDLQNELNALVGQRIW